MKEVEEFKNFHQVAGILHMDKNVESIPYTDKKGEAKNFNKKEFILELKSSFDGQVYREFIPFEMKEKHFALLEPFSVGDAIVVHYRLGGAFSKKDKERCFGRNTAYKVTELPEEIAVDMGLKDSQTALDEAFDHPTIQTSPTDALIEKELDDLPF